MFQADSKSQVSYDAQQFPNGPAGLSSYFRFLWVKFHLISNETIFSLKNLKLRILNSLHWEGRLVDNNKSSVCGLRNDYLPNLLHLTHNLAQIWIITDSWESWSLFHQESFISVAYTADEVRYSWLEGETC